MRIDATKIVDLRNDKGWTQQHLADACALSLRTIQRVEKEGMASSETVLALCSVLEVERKTIESSFHAEQKRLSQDAPERAPSWIDALPMLITLLLGMAIGIGLTLWLTNR